VELNTHYTSGRGLGKGKESKAKDGGKGWNLKKRGGFTQRKGFRRINKLNARKSGEKMTGLPPGSFKNNGKVMDREKRKKDYLKWVPMGGKSAKKGDPQERVRVK